MPMWLIMFGYNAGAGALVVFTAALAGLALIPPYELFVLVEQHVGMMWAVASLPLLYIVWGVDFCLLVVVVRYAFFLKAREGDHNLFSFMTGVWGVMGFLVRIADNVFMRHLAGTPFIVLWYRALGAKIGKNCSINCAGLGDCDLITIGDNVSVGAASSIIPHAVEKNRIIMRPIVIGDNCTLGLRTTVMPGVVMEERSILAAHAVTTKDQHMEAGGIYGGTPAVLVGHRDKPAEKAEVPEAVPTGA
jgi:non-ribosomal peptide synthetase-like protein